MVVHFKSALSRHLIQLTQRGRGRGYLSRGPQQFPHWDQLPADTVPALLSLLCLCLLSSGEVCRIPPQPARVITRLFTSISNFWGGSLMSWAGLIYWKAIIVCLHLGDTQPNLNQLSTLLLLICLLHIYFNYSHYSKSNMYFMYSFNIWWWWHEFILILTLF